MIVRNTLGAAGMLAVLASISLGAGSANAALVSCPGSFTTDPTAKVENAAGTMTAASACQYITPANPASIANIATINANAFFGFSDWQGNGQTEINQNSLSGSWSIASVNFALYDYIIVFKDGANTNLTAFLFNEQYSSGVWSTPFTDPPFNFPGAATAREVSHLTIARRESGTVVPEPATLALLGTALLGLGLARRRRAGVTS